jgi:hypothetical protein
MSKCSVADRDSDADYEVIFYDLYPQSDISIFYELHNSCPCLCQHHLNENEHGAETGLPNKRLRSYRGMVNYPHANSGGMGFCIYKPIT